MVVWRVRQDGTYGCTVPCILCRQQLVRLDLRVTCPLQDGGPAWYRGKLDVPGAPESRLTQGQRTFTFRRE